MAEFIIKEVLSGVMGMIREHLERYQEEIDTAYVESGELEDDNPDKIPNKRISVSLNVNLTNKEDRVKIKTTIAFTPKKIKESNVRMIDPDQPELPFGEQSGNEDALDAETH